MRCAWSLFSACDFSQEWYVLGSPEVRSVHNVVSIRRPRQLSRISTSQSSEGRIRILPNSSFAAGLRKIYSNLPHDRCFKLAYFDMHSLQKRPLQPPTASHVFPICRTTVQTGFRDPLQQPARPIRYTTRSHRRSLFGFLPRKVHLSCSSLTFCTNRLIFRRRIEAT